MKKNRQKRKDKLHRDSISTNTINRQIAYNKTS